MSLALRVDDIEATPSGRHVVLSFGQAPLPAQSMGRGIEKSVAEWLDEADYFDELSQEDRYLFLLRLLLLLWKRNNPAMNNPAILIGKTLTLEITTTTITATVS